MFDAIKSLSVQQRLFAFIFAILMSSGVSLLTVYLKTDDCGDISDRYNEVIQNQNDLMEVNNEILGKYNDARRDFLAIQDQLISLQDHLRNVEVPVFQQLAFIDSAPSFSYDDTSALAYAPSPMVYSPPIVIENSNEEIITSIDSILLITGKYCEK